MITVAFSLLCFVIGLVMGAWLWHVVRRKWFYRRTKRRFLAAMANVDTRHQVKALPTDPGGTVIHVPGGTVESEQVLTADQVKRFLDLWREIRSNADDHEVTHLCPGQQYPTIGTEPVPSMWQEIRAWLGRLFRRRT